MRRATALLLAMLALGAAPAWAEFSSALSHGLAHSMAGASAERSAGTAAAALKLAQASVDGALKLRKQRWQSWQKVVVAKESAAADVANKKRAGIGGTALASALKKTLALDEESARARSSLLAAEAELARGGAALLQLYDALLVERRRTIEALPARSAARGHAAAAYQQLSTQRDAVRTALLPVLAERSFLATSDQLELPRVDLDARADDDVETLLEKADLARDLEARFLRQAEAVRKRIVELEEEQAVARDVSGMVGRSQLFDEEDRRVLVLRPEATPANDTSTTGRSNGGNAPARAVEDDGFAGAPVAEGADAEAPPPSAPSVASGGVRASSGLIASSSAAAAPAPRSGQGVGLTQTDAAMSGLLTSSGASVESLRALQAKLKGQALALREKSNKLKSEAKTRAHPSGASAD